MKIAKVQEMVFIDKSNKWFHTIKFFQVISYLHMVSIMQDDGSTSDPQLKVIIKMKNASLTFKSSSLANGWPMIWHRGGCPTNWYQGQRSFMWYLKGYKWCHSNNQEMSIKNARFKPQPSTPNANLCINKKNTFLWKLMTKGERLYKDMKALGDIEEKK